MLHVMRPARIDKIQIDFGVHAPTDPMEHETPRQILFSKRWKHHDAHSLVQSIVGIQSCVNKT